MFMYGEFYSYYTYDTHVGRGNVWLLICHELKHCLMDGWPDGFSQMILGASACHSPSFPLSYYAGGIEKVSTETLNKSK